ncbi:hypothetical protein ACFRJ9_14485 [Paenarthrobacter sp. NPDC056912]|uniref:hypothetical protein n=1 Tax=Paenarthrobacter sp. NPDC056912 TaxID=3345965 RepID=UPI00367145F6
MNRPPGRVTGAVLAVTFLAGVLSGCSTSPTAESLEGPAKSVSAALRATTLAVDLRSRERTTAAAGTTVADDMLREVQSAIDDVEGLTVATEDEQSLRDSTVATFTTVSRTILHARDALTAPTGESGNGQTGQLPGVLDELRGATDQLDALMTRAGIQ